MQFFRLLQHASTTAGLIAISVFVYKMPEEALPIPDYQKLKYFWPGTIIVALIVFGLRVNYALGTLGGMVTNIMGALSYGLIICSLYWHLTLSKK